MRVFEHKRVWMLERQTYDCVVALLLESIRELWEVEVVIGIARGGREPARQIAGQLQVPYYEVKARYNSSDELYSATDASITVDFSALPDDGRRLKAVLVDDICGTGTTMITVRDHLVNMRHYHDVYTVALCRNAGSAFTPDLYVWQTDDWVVFPWETQPTSIAMVPLPAPVSLLGRQP